MGNLYTHLETRSDKNIERLVKLKQLWEVVRRPVNRKQKDEALEEIQLLQKEIDQEKMERTKPKSLDEKYGGSFAWKAREMGLK